MYTGNNAVRHPRVARKLKIELRHERLVQAEVLEQIKKLRNALNMSPSEGSLPLATRVPTNRHNDPFPRTQGERAVERSRAGTDKDGISVANKALGTMHPPALPEPAWSKPKSGVPNRPTTPSVVAMLRPRVQLHKDAIETALDAAVALRGGTLDGEAMQSSLESIGVKISPMQVLASYAGSHCPAHSCIIPAARPRPAVWSSRRRTWAALIPRHLILKSSLPCRWVEAGSGGRGSCQAGRAGLIHGRVCDSSAHLVPARCPISLASQTHCIRPPALIVHPPFTCFLGRYSRCCAGSSASWMDALPCTPS